LAGKTNANESAIDKTSYFWTFMCSGCHPGGGPSEYDRDGLKYFDVVTGQFGYELLGKSAGDVTLDGDYALLDTTTGALVAARWDVTGVSEPDCMHCHRRDWTVDTTGIQNALWRGATMRGRHLLTDDAGLPVPAFAAAATAGQGWFSNFVLMNLPPGSPPTAETLQIDYTVGLANRTLVEDAQGRLLMPGGSIVHQPKDHACWGCHALADQKKRGRVWFDPSQDVHYAHFNNLDDADPANDKEPTESTACTECHPAGAEHQFAKGRATAGTVLDELDYQDLRDCRDCHDPASPLHHPEATPYTSPIHTARHLEVLACQVCHIPHVQGPAQLAIDNAVTGIQTAYYTDQFLSADPLDPADPDKSRWFPSLDWKVGKDGKERLFPNKLLLTMWWGDWDDNGTPGDTTDDLIQPVALWRVRQITAGVPLPGTADDNGDGIPEVNTEAEIHTYIQALKGTDSYGVQVAARPVLVKGGRVWYEDPGTASGVNWFPLQGSGIKAESEVPFSKDHNVLPPASALGAAGDCGSCHWALNGGGPTMLFDRLILVDTFDETGAPVYETIRERTGLSPF